LCRCCKTSRCGYWGKEKIIESKEIKEKVKETVKEDAKLKALVNIIEGVIALLLSELKPDELEKLHEKIRSLESAEKRLKMAWKILIDDVFSKDIVKLGTNTGKITVENVVSFSFDGDVQMEIERSLYPITPIFVESPILLEIKPYLAKTTERKIKSLELPIHIGSFFDYVETISRIEDDEILKELREIIGGDVYYSIHEDRFYFKSEQYEKPFDIQNVASGIKSFGVLQLLLRSGACENTIFFWEEPESHLHPEWQIKFAEIVAKIVEKNNYFVISTHSPFMVEILRVVAKENEIDARFYYMDKNSELIEVDDENWDIISDSLLRPLRKIAFRLFRVV
jgi:predicted ATPase